MTALELIRAERERQIQKEGFPAEHDRQHTNGELAWAAVYYAMPEKIEVYDKGFYANFGPMLFFPSNWSLEWEKRDTKPRLRQVVVAAALLVAEAERLLAEQRQGEESA